MIEFLLTLLKIALSAAPFVALCFANRRVNLAKPDRSRQFAMPLVAGGYVLLTMLLMSQINEWLLQLFDALPGWIAAPATWSWMPEWLANAFVGMSDGLRWFF